VRRLLFIFLLVSVNVFAQEKLYEKEGAWYRSDTTQKAIYLIFTGHDFDEGFPFVMKTLNEEKVKASFFLTGTFVQKHRRLIKDIMAEGHFVGPHSDRHLLYCDWVKRDSLLVSEKELKHDYLRNLKRLNKLGIFTNLFMPPYEWYNRQVNDLLKKSFGVELVNFTPGTSSNADYTTPNVVNYKSSQEIYDRIIDYEAVKGLNGFHLLIHPGTDPERTDKFYLRLPDLLNELKTKGYRFERFNESSGN
jgi:peptidoglycan/xylan/chitin deacetylase (PgdA/CDA1 family)